MSADKLLIQALVTRLLDLREQAFTGSVTLHYHQGEVAKVETRETQRLGSFVYKTPQDVV